MADVEAGVWRKTRRMRVSAMLLLDVRKAAI